MTSSEEAGEAAAAAQDQGGKGRDLEVAVGVTLEEAFRGTEKKVTVPRHDKCPVCGGNGAKPGTT